MRNNAITINGQNSTALPPSQTAPETVSLLQQPVQNSKYASTVVIQGRGGFSREKPRSRMSHYTGQITNHYQNYPQMQNQQSFESRPRPSPPQMQYLHPNVEFKSKSSPTGSRPFKLPSPPLVPVTTQQVPLKIYTIYEEHQSTVCYMKQTFILISFDQRF